MKVMKWKNELISLGLIVIMVLISELFQSPSLIFPEAAALTIGAWLMVRQPWQAPKPHFAVLMTVSALAGFGLVRLPMPIVAQICIGFAFCGVLLTLTKTSVTPIISACALPILMQETSFFYVVAVAIVSTIVIVARYFLEQYGWVKVHTYQPVEISLDEAAHKWLRLIAALFVLALIATLLNVYYIIAPPLIVAFVELYEPKSKWRRSALSVWCLLTIGGVIGTLCRFLLSICLGIPVTISALLAVVLLYIAFTRFRLFFPPAGAITLLPMILPAEGILWYILQVAIGAAIFIVLAFVLSATQYNQKHARR